jgi:HD-GYP domain-containing protein (c-di-GMP phosphodiesterase class II)
MYAQKGEGRRSAAHQARDVLIQTLREREPDLHEHMTGVAQRSVLLARHLGLSAEAIDEIGRAAELHDLGKIAVPAEILHKPGPLDEEEWRFMRQHTIIGERILAAAPALGPVARLVRSSHERHDGCGYPDGLAGDEIPIGARVVALCDAYDAMVSDRAYRPGMAPEAALAEIERCRGTQFDPVVVDAFVELFGSNARVSRFEPGALVAR